MLEATAILLAAGRGTRMGGPKALLRVPSADGRPVPWAARVASAYARSIVVTTADIRVALERLAPFRSGKAALLASTMDDALGPAGSIAVAVRHLALSSASTAPIVVSPIDALASEGTVRALLERIARAPAAEAVVPCFEGRGGHPVVVRGRALVPYLTGVPTLRDVLRGIGDRALRLDVDDAGVRANINTPEDAVRWLGVAEPLRFRDEAPNETR